MHKTRISRVKRTIRETDRFRKLRKAFDTLPQYQIPFDEYRKELKLLHNTRKVKALEVSDPNFLRSLCEASIQDTANRGRMTELLVQAVGVEKKLSRTLSSFKDYILSEYADELKIISTKAERIDFVESCLRGFYNYLNDVERFTIEVRLYIEDIDKSSFTVKHLVDAFATIRKAEGTVRL